MFRKDVKRLIFRYCGAIWESIKGIENTLEKLEDRINQVEDHVFYLSGEEPISKVEDLKCCGNCKYNVPIIKDRVITFTCSRRKGKEIFIKKLCGSWGYDGIKLKQRL